MRRYIHIIYVLFSALMASCSDGVDDTWLNESSHDGGGVEFSLAALTRSGDLKNEWMEGDTFAIFEDGDRDQSSCYTISSSDLTTLTPSSDDDLIEQTTSAEYVAFYPYVAGWSYSDYTTALAETFSDTDYLTSGEFSAATELSFSHVYAALELTVKLGYGYSNYTFNDISAELTVGSNTSESVTIQYNDDNSEATLVTFVLPDEYESNSMLMYVDFGTLSKIVIVEFSTSNFSQSGTCYSAHAYITLPVEVGEGTEANPFRIYTAEDMEAVGKNSDYTSYAATINGDGSADWSLSSNYIVMNDIELDGGEENQWTPIGDKTTPYTGSFDGGGHTISGLYINVVESYQGLFGYISSATIKGVIVEGMITGNQELGGIAGFADGNTTISQCGNHINITAVYNNQLGYIVGGILGCISDTSSDHSIKITECYNCSVLIASKTIGGILGQVHSSTESTVNVTHCYNVGNIYSYYSDSYGSPESGGLLGYMKSTSENKVTASYSYSAAGVSSAQTATTVVWMGGFLGSGYSNNYSYCYYDDDVLDDYVATIAVSSTNYYCAKTPYGFCYNWDGSDMNNCEGYNNEEMTDGTLLNKLGSTYWLADDTDINNGYPVLRWQVEGTSNE